MAHLAPDADQWAGARIGIFFPAHNETPADGNLTGQCVTLNKWFLYEMTDVPSPFAARGDARYVGRTLVAQGHAVEVPYDQRQRGDFICYEYGTYGHIALQLSGGRVFEENVNMPGTTRRIVDGDYVYSARIGSENESWRVGKNPHVYRLKTYSEGEQAMKIRGNFTYDQLNRLHRQLVGNWDMPKTYWDSIQDYDFAAVVLDLSNNSNANLAMQQQEVGENAIRDRWDLQIYSLQAQLKALGDRPTKEQLDAIQAQVNAAKEELAKAQAALKAKQDADAEADKVGQGFIRWLINKIRGES